MDTYDCAYISMIYDTYVYTYIHVYTHIYMYTHIYYTDAADRLALLEVYVSKLNLQDVDLEVCVY